MGRRNLRIWVWPVVLCAGVVGGLAFVLPRLARETPIDVKVARAGVHDIANLVTTNGIVEPQIEFQARANFPGMVQKVPVQLADKVQAGQMLVTMKDPFAVSRVTSATSAVANATEFNQSMQGGGTQEEHIAASADLQHARLARDEAQNSLEVLRKLQQQGAAGAGEVATASRRLKDAEVTLEMLQRRSDDRFSPATLSAAHARVEDAEALLGAAKIAFSNANIATPISGTVYSVSVSPYDFVPMGADLVRVADLNRMQIRAYFDEAEVGKLKEGQSVTVTWDGRPGITWHGRIRKAPVAAMPQGNRSVAECLIQLEDSKGDLLPNTHVVVTVPIERHTSVLTIPRQALQGSAQDAWVFRVSGGRLIRTAVNVGLVNLESVEIDKGLAPQDTVAIKAIDDQPLRDGMLVREVH